MVEPSYAKRFWSKVERAGPEDCWNFLGCKNKLGYGKFRVRGKTIEAYRIAWTIVNGNIPKGKFILHYCDNSSCVNPNHLYCGTHADNMRDNCNRNISSISHPKFYMKELLQIRKFKKVISVGINNNYKVPIKEVAKRFNCAIGTIHNIWYSDKYMCKEGFYLHFNS